MFLFVEQRTTTTTVPISLFTNTVPVMLPMYLEQHLVQVNARVNVGHLLVSGPLLFLLFLLVQQQQQQ